MRIKLKLGDKEYASTLADMSNLSIGEIRAIKRETGMSAEQFGARFGEFADMDPKDPDMDLIVGLVYLLRRRSGDKCTWADAEDVPAVHLRDAFSVVDDEPAPDLAVDVPLGDLVMVDD